MHEQEKLIINFSEQSLAQIVASSLEAFVIPHDAELSNWTGIETFLTLWGNQSGSELTTCLNVEFAIPSTSAQRDYASVVPNESINLKHDFISAYFPQYRMIGDLHTHPYIRGRNSAHSASTIRKQRLYSMSVADIDASVSDLWQKYDLGYRVSAVLTLINLGRENTAKDGSLENNVIEFSLNNYKCWLYVMAFDYMTLDELTELDRAFIKAHPHCVEDDVAMVPVENVIIRAPSLLSLHEYQRFGTVSGKRKLKHTEG